MRTAFAIGLIVCLLVACGDKTKPKPVALPPAPHGLDAAQVARGGDLYREHCAACHGDRAQGTANWNSRGADGKFPPPPLDGTGYASHHSRDWLVKRIKEGTLQQGGSMPAWNGRLADADIEAMVSWIIALWPDDVYEDWRAMQETAAHHQRPRKPL